MSRCIITKKIERRSLCKSELKVKPKDKKLKRKVNEASSSTSLRRKESGSLTVEAAIVVPLFLWCVLIMFYFYFLIDIQGDITMSMAKVAKKLGQYQYCQEEYSECFSSEYISNAIIKEMGKDRLNQSCIRSGEKGFECTLRNKSANKVDIIIKYYLRIPVPIFNLLEYPIIQRTLVHGWTGFDKEEVEETQELMVFIAEEGNVYHLYRSCTYLDLSIRCVEARSIEKLRNKAGAKYHPCEKCGKNMKGNIAYITDWGDKFHTSLSCSGLKRSVRTVPISQIGQRRRCSKCW